MKTRLVPVYDAKGNIVLFDMYVDDKWCGSRRTMEQCKAFLESILRKANVDVK